MGTLLVGAVVLVIIGAVVRKLYRDKRAGKGCHGGCESCGGCPGAGRSGRG